MKYKNITRYTYETTAFQGWRLCIIRHHQQFVKYFSELNYGSEEKALAAALEMRNKILADLNLHEHKEAEIITRYTQAEKK